MEFQKYIDSSTDLISDLKKEGFKIKSYKGLKIISYSYDNVPSLQSENDLWKLYCRGVVIDSKKQIICLPPMKAIEIKNEEELEQISEMNNYEELIDGTMINLFNYDDEWLISTRSEIGGYNKWGNKKSFKQMFDECKDFDMNDLNKDYSYSFVLRHTENRNISPIQINELYLVEMYQFKNDNKERNIRKLNKNEYPSNFLKISICENGISLIQDMKKKPYYCKGYTIKTKNRRYKIINPNFEKIKGLKMNTNNLFINYLELRKNKNVINYLKYFPEHTYTFNHYRNKIHNISNELYTYYKNIYIYKKTNKKEIPYHLKPLMNDIHKQYLQTKKPTSWDDIKNYINNLPSKKLYFAINQS